ncbi:MAG: thioredoxin-disulfide reductase [Candidatus Aquicultor secundus]|uniref:Thioredoxin-disulfide reductase n=1 Tax=Candidatus Aquicultor secundus TaxID=1973895 RepID=A0A2M7T5M4_9ACTN|nr:FAD-dependent oxidoreductase [Candidatus Aquicultor secundus]NCO65764.1 FAD-dependent oxidoreductase [Solirubrobacter sp.]OIO84877.1 MAG: thioredoxin-disulfide reductase [Candidatus Aquicultor secundus]PIU26164.1 MAG: thioredoxin-disulfide reductase [Candidatus Aquicultor secundus]PIW21529.1 MAG: thioredoxin-disulfide reductase [Candidatus Aquicultor secundus]PIX52926.1 MAG: thioredoxin-disulfide reductase [Candidatus Aquicultor secundus]
MHDVVIIGAGPAGMTAAVYAARKKMDALVLTNNIGGMAAWSAGIENYMGYNLIPGAELMAKFEEQVEEFGIPIEYQQVDKVTKEDSFFNIHIVTGEVIRAKSVIMATGRSPRRLNVPGEKEFVGRGVTYCATCDAPLFKNMDVAVIGGGNSALGAAEQLIKIAKTVNIVSIAGWSADPIIQERVLHAPNVGIYKGYDLTAIEGHNFVEGIKIKARKTGEEVELAVRGVFFEIGSAPSSTPVKDLVELDEKQEIIVDCSNKTSIPGLFAAGDVTSVPQKQIIVAAGEGAKAALSAYDYVIRLPEDIK